VADRNRATFDDFVAQHGDALLRTAVFVVGDEHAAKDVLQDALLRAFRYWRRIDDPYPYVRTAVVNGATSRRRRHSYRDVALTDRHSGLVLVDHVDQLPTRDLVVTALRSLTPKQRAVLVLRYYEDMSEAEIASMLGCKPGTVKTHAARGLERLRQILGDDVTLAPGRGAQR
jgi:RNA polymerase sigma-70 factor (sigma-E family)